MAITWANVALIAPELGGDALTSDQQTAILADVATELGDTPGSFGSDARYDQAAKYLAAHIGTVTLAAGATGAVVSESIGPFSVTRAAPTSGTGTTSYGERFEDLCQGYVPSRVGVGSARC